MTGAVERTERKDTSVRVEIMIYGMEARVEPMLKHG